jgi:hypothetical protein
MFALPLGSHPHNSYTWLLDMLNDTDCPHTSHMSACQVWTSCENAITSIDISSKQTMLSLLSYADCTDSRWGTDKWPFVQLHYCPGCGRYPQVTCWSDIPGMGTWLYCCRSSQLLWSEGDGLFDSAAWNELINIKSSNCAPCLNWSATHDKYIPYSRSSFGVGVTFMTVIGQTETTQNMALFSSQKLIKLVASLTKVDSTSCQQKQHQSGSGQHS